MFIVQYDASIIRGHNRHYNTLIKNISMVTMVTLHTLSFPYHNNFFKKIVWAFFLPLEKVSKMEQINFAAKNELKTFKTRCQYKLLRGSLSYLMLRKG